MQIHCYLIFSLVFPFFPVRCRELEFQCSGFPVGSGEDNLWPTFCIPQVDVAQKTANSQTSFLSTAITATLQERVTWANILIDHLKMHCGEKSFAIHFTWTWPWASVRRRPMLLNVQCSAVQWTWPTSKQCSVNTEHDPIPPWAGWLVRRRGPSWPPIMQTDVQLMTS